MARDIVIIGSILLFWLFLTFTLTFANADPSFSNAKNPNPNITIDVNAFNDSQIPTELNALTSINPLNFMRTFLQIFTFRAFNPDAPEIIQVGLTLFNWLLASLFGITIYTKMIRSGGG